MTDAEKHALQPLVTAINAAVARHGSLRAAARVLKVDAGHLSRIRAGKKAPGDALLRRLSIVKAVTYHHADGDIDARWYITRAASGRCATCQPIDRSDAVNLARNIRDQEVRAVTDKGIDCLAEAVLRMDEYIRALQPEVQAWSNCERCGAAYLHQHPEADPAVVAEQRACEAAEWKNAARYRFLKAYQPPRGEPGLVEELCLEIPSDGWDAAIDKAMAAASKPQKRSPADGAS